MQNKKTNKRFKLSLLGGIFHGMGMFILRRSLGQQFALFCKAMASLFSKNRNFRTDAKNIITQTFFTGVEIFPVLFVVATLFGTAVIIEVMTMMGKMGFSDVIGNMLVIVIIRELGPILTAFLIAGRSGSSLTTYIGSMVINSEVDALATMGVNPIRFLVMPGLIGGCIAMFFMNIIFSSTAIFVGYLATKGAIFMSGNALNLQLTWSYLSTEILNAISLTDFIFIILKPLVFGAIITTNACYQALNIPRDVRQVPKATSRSVIKSFLYIVCADVILSFFYFVDYMNNINSII
ncbi:MULTISPECIES: ABC transporter permease [unclassified Fibrobacter]|uniref:MlaE family ABC transporter permease n=1 Tax=unclassified Fibrobacter TaxID=2634177 RepID=UPI000D6C25CA|nr:MULTISPECIES: ABC transporter permease [unclassified Fibrobacter]PWJ68113.1 phospholipid/cholesterol/gamma-HCH transport system permease protein [Fibrobacter sp. UWR4]PZW71848.1 phospholipid/cholesterol/gamma-HCH transport system permease protein [Fibrobacter sp. UWR1]